MKFPKIFHFPWSRSISSDDKILSSTEIFAGKEIIMCEKLDGECTGMSRDKCHARSLDSRMPDH